MIRVNEERRDAVTAAIIDRIKGYGTPTRTEVSAEVYKEYNRRGVVEVAYEEFRVVNDVVFLTLNGKDANFRESGFYSKRALEFGKRYGYSVNTDGDAGVIFFRPELTAARLIADGDVTAAEVIALYERRAAKSAAKSAAPKKTAAKKTAAKKKK